MPPFLGHCSVKIKKKKEKKKEGRGKDEFYTYWEIGFSAHDVGGHSCKFA